MKISFIIPAYNEEAKIENCIRAIQNQTIAPFEIILIDNNSSDRTGEIARNLNVKVINEPRQGLLYTRNTGFNNAKGDILAKIDSDSLLPPDWSQKVIEAFSSKDTVAVSGPIVFHDFPKILQKPLLHKLIFTYLSKLVYGHSVLNGPHYALRRAVWNKIKDEEFVEYKHEDMELSNMLKKYGNIVFDSNLIVPTSGRRLKDVKSVLYKYPSRWIYTVIHDKLK